MKCIEHWLKLKFSELKFEIKHIELLIWSYLQQVIFYTSLKALIHKLLKYYDKKMVWIPDKNKFIQDSKVFLWPQKIENFAQKTTCPKVAS